MIRLFNPPTAPAWFTPFVQSAERALRSVPAPVTDEGVVVSWTASGTAPAIGDGSLSGRYDIIGNMCFYTVRLGFGSTTTAGTGDWTFSLPFASVGYALGNWWILDAGTGYHSGVALIEPGSTAQLYPNGSSASKVGATVPITWASGDTLQLTVSYPITRG